MTVAGPFQGPLIAIMAFVAHDYSCLYGRPMSPVGTKRTSRSGLMMSVDRGRPEVAFRGCQDSFLTRTDIGPDWFWGEQRAFSHSPFGRKVLVLAIARGMLSAGSNATTRVHHTGWRRRGFVAVRDGSTAVRSDKTRWRAFRPRTE